MAGRPIGKKSNSGGTAAPRRTNGNIDWDEVYDIYIRPTLNSQLAPNTSRGLMYYQITSSNFGRFHYRTN